MGGPSQDGGLSGSHSNSSTEKGALLSLKVAEETIYMLPSNPRHSTVHK